MDEIVRITREADLVLYCLDMRRRLDKHEAKGIKKLTAVAGVDIWKNAMFALTFGNKIKPQDKAEDRLGYFTSVYSSWKHAIRRLFQEKIHAPEDIITQIAIVPTGYRSKPPPDRVDWFTPFWEASFHKTKQDAQPNLIGANIDRFYLRTTDTEAQVGTPNEEQQQEDVEPHKMRINLVLTPRIVTAAVAGGMILGSTGVGALVGIAGGPIGIGAGAVIGFGTGVITTAVLVFLDKYSDTPTTPELTTVPPLQK